MFCISDYSMPSFMCGRGLHLTEPVSQNRLPLFVCLFIYYFFSRNQLFSDFQNHLLHSQGGAYATSSSLPPSFSSMPGTKQYEPLPHSIFSEYTVNEFSFSLSWKSVLFSSISFHTMDKVCVKTLKVIQMHSNEYDIWSCITKLLLLIADQYQRDFDPSKLSNKYPYTDSITDPKKCLSFT